MEEQQSDKEFVELLTRLIWLVKVINITIPNGRSRRLYLLKLSRVAEKLAKLDFGYDCQIQLCSTFDLFYPTESYRKEVKPLPIP